MTVSEPGPTGFVNSDDAFAFKASRALGRLAAGAYRGSPPTQVVIVRRCDTCGDQTHGRPEAVGGPNGLSTSRRRHLVAAAVADRAHRV